MKNLFFVFEGADRVGKSTIIKVVVKKLQTKLKNYAFLVTKQPNTEIVSQGENKILTANIQNDQTSQILFFLLDRKLNLNLIDAWSKNNFKKNKIVICDRYFYSTFAYQTSGSEQEMKQLIELHQITKTWKIPEGIFFLTGNENTFKKHSQKMKSQNKAKNQHVRDLFHHDDSYDFFETNNNNSPMKIQKKYKKVFEYFSKSPYSHNVLEINMDEETETNTNKIVNEILRLCE